MTSQFSGKKLPPHWLHVPSRRQVRDLLEGIAADVRCVNFDGTGSGLRWGPSLLLGYLERRVVDEAWCFYLRLRGVPEAAILGQRDELARAVIQILRESITECLALRAADVIKPTQLILMVRIGTEGVIPKCRVEPVGPYSFSAGRWWESPRRTR